MDCHNQQNAEGNRDFESLGLPLTSELQIVTATEIIDQLTLRQMPPQDAEQPTTEDSIAFIEFLRDNVQDARMQLKSTGGRTVLRRLTNREYENTLATLFGRRVDTLGLTTEFPSETATHNLERIGSEMITSGVLLDKYFAAANRLIELRLNKEEMASQEWHFQGNFKVPINRFSTIAIFVCTSSPTRTLARGATDTLKIFSKGFRFPDFTTSRCKPKRCIETHITILRSFALILVSRFSWLLSPVMLNAVIFTIRNPSNQS
jgi:hypothetical protein